MKNPTILKGGKEEKYGRLRDRRECDKLTTRRKRGGGGGRPGGQGGHIKVCLEKTEEVSFKARKKMSLKGQNLIDCSGDLNTQIICVKKGGSSKGRAT